MCTVPSEYLVNDAAKACGYPSVLDYLEPLSDLDGNRIQLNHRQPPLSCYEIRTGNYTGLASKPWSYAEAEHDAK